MKIKMKYLMLGFIICLICVWVGSLINCELLTYKHYDEFKDAYKQNTMLGDMEYFKVLNYSSYDIAQVYYVSKGYAMGNVLYFKYDFDNDTWKEISWGTGWSASGNADNVIYPYWWHFIYFMF